MRVKGTLVVEYVKLIRANKDKNWDKWLRPEDWEIINYRILASSWYDYDFVKRITLAVFDQIAGSSLEAARIFGRETTKKWIHLYRFIVVPDDPIASVYNLAKLKRTFVSDNAGFDIQPIEHGEDWIKCQINIPLKEDDSNYVAANCHYFSGLVEEVIAQSGEEILKSSIELKDSGYEVLVTWK